MKCHKKLNGQDVVIFIALPHEEMPRNRVIETVVELIENKSAPSERTMPKYNLIKLSL